jgi:small subunit ribosomal protein S22
LTSKQLEEYENNAMQRGQDFLQMPPVKHPWLSKTRTICVDDIANFEKGDSSYVFTDITYGLPHRQRVVVIRQSDGTLRWGSREEHDRILHVYYPQPGKMYAMPKMFEEEHLEKVLAEQRYEYVLDRACVQFEPDDPNYIRVSQRTYEHLANHGRFEDLRSTRHFGPMAYYFAVHGKIDGLLIDMLQRGLLLDAVDLVKLYHILHPNSKSAAAQPEQETDPEKLIQVYAKLDAANGGAVDLALQAYYESVRNPDTQKKSTSAS